MIDEQAGAKLDFEEVVGVVVPILNRSFIVGMFLKGINNNVSAFNDSPPNYRDNCCYMLSCYFDRIAVFVCN